MAGKAAFIGVDVGTGSVRAALVSIEGQIIGNVYVHSFPNKRAVYVYKALHDTGAQLVRMRRVPAPVLK